MPDNATPQRPAREKPHFGDLHPFCNTKWHGRMCRVVMSHLFDGRSGHSETWVCDRCGFKREIFYPDVRPELAQLLNRKRGKAKA